MNIESEDIIWWKKKQPSGFFMSFIMDDYDYGPRMEYNWLLYCIE